MDQNLLPLALGDGSWADVVLDNAPVAVFLKDLEGRLHYANCCFETWYGIRTQDWIDKTSFELWPRQQAEQFVALDREVLETGNVVRDEGEIRSPDGEVRRILITKFPVRDASGRITGIGTINTNVADLPARGAASSPVRLDPVWTSNQLDHRGARVLDLERDLHRVTDERDVAEAALFEKQHHLQLVTDNLPVLIVHYDTQLRYRFVNDTYRRWRRMERTALIGKTIAEVVGQELFLRTEPQFARALTGAQLWFEYSDTFPDGKARDIHGVLIPERDRDGQVIGVFGLGTDVTELKRMERKLLRQERLATLGQVAGTVAHELRTPLATITASATILRRLHEDSPHQVTRTLERIVRGVGRCSAVIEELLNYMRVPAIVRQTVDLDAWLDAELDTWSLPAAVSLIRDLRADISVDVDCGRLAQALENLRDNALQAMRPDSESSPNGTLTIGARRHDGRIEILVGDTGDGIAAEHREQVFEPLFSLRTVGVGLGLPLVRRIMEEHGGGAEIAETTSSGTRMLLWLPITVRE